VTQSVVGKDLQDSVQLRIPCKAEWVAVARLAVAAVANRLKFSIEEIEDVKLAVAEACTNAIQHSDGTGQIEILCLTEPDGLRVRVRDHSYGTPSEHVRTLSAEEVRVGGLGVFLIRSLMDEVEYDAHPERGTDLTMVKRLRT
jgi:serine/threonine-protein kinase RsbW